MRVLTQTEISKMWAILSQTDDYSDCEHLSLSEKLEIMNTDFSGKRMEITYREMQRQNQKSSTLIKV